MSFTFTFILIVLGLLAVSGIVVGVANDAVNFLNSALGSKAAPRRIIMAVASVGIMIGTLTSGGMMDVARSGVFHPDQFTFSQIMVIFFGVMLGNVILLDLFNTLGLPTSTSVSLVFGLLGAALAGGAWRIGSDPALTASDLSLFINSGKTMVFISAILLSVVLAFAAGILFMYLSRLIFSFRYHTMLRRLGALWCGISFTGILYFALIKGLNNSGLIPADAMQLLHDNTLLTLLGLWAASSLLLWVLQRLGINILKVTILTGTLSLALAFAGNDLVNFIGVPLAGYDSYRLAQASGDMQMSMEALLQPAHANIWILLGAGVVMVLTLLFNRKAMHVTQTELDLASQNEHEEQFGSTFLSRALVRSARSLNNAYLRCVPRKVQAAIDRRFVQLPPHERGDAPYDMIRATVNLTAASILISIGTSLKLPLSTTYVVFMVAMGTSLVDKAWGRESAVYRITGVMTVITGWFVTALAACAIAFAVTLLLLWGGTAAAIALTLLCGGMLFHSNFIRKMPAVGHKETPERLDAKADSEQVLYTCIEDVCQTMEQVTRIYNRTLVAVFKENRKVLRDMVRESNELFYDARKRKYDVLPTLRRLEGNDIDTGHFYVQVTDYLSEVTKALIHITRPSLEHIDNNHEGLSREQVVDLMRVNDEVESIFQRINEMLRSKDFSSLDQVLLMRDRLFDTIVGAIKNQLRRIKQGNTPTKASMLYLTILGETKTMVLQARNLLKSQSHFLEHRSA